MADMKEGTGILLETALSNPETYGFKWETGDIAGDNGKKPLGKIPLISWTNIAAMQKAFGEAFALELVNGSQSIRVRIQNKLRPMVEAGDVKRDDLKAMRKIVVEEVLQGGTSRRVRTVSVQVFTTADGKTFETADEAAKHTAALELAKAQESIGRLVDMGLSLEQAKAALGLTALGEA